VPATAVNNRDDRFRGRLPLRSFRLLDLRLIADHAARIMIAGARTFTFQYRIVRLRVSLGGGAGDVPDVAG
jgi:hypothetical protein